MDCVVFNEGSEGEPRQRAQSRLSQRRPADPMSRVEGRRDDEDAQPDTDDTEGGKLQESKYDKRENPDREGLHGIASRQLRCPVKVHAP